MRKAPRKGRSHALLVIKGVIITKRGEAIATQVPIDRPKEKDLQLGAIEGLFETIGESTEPVIDDEAREHAKNRS